LFRIQYNCGPNILITVYLMRSLLIIFSVLFSLGGFASTVRDSIGAENTDGTLTILHKVEPKENYYSIGRIYKISPKKIGDFNNNVSLKPGLIIKVPTTRAFATQMAETVQKETAETIIDYKVGPREFLYALAKRFNTSVEDIKKLNNLKSNNLSIGQMLKIHPGTNAEPVKAPEPEPIVTASTDEADTEQRPKIPTGRLGISEKSERGVAIWIEGENLDETKMLALHKTAPVGTVIKVTNPMTDKVTFVKVVGKFTENESTKDVIIVLTKATADLLGVLDKRFQVSIDYGIPNE